MTGAANGDAAAAPRQNPKRWVTGDAKQQRRLDALKRQRDRRRDLTDKVRECVLAAMHNEPDEEEAEKQQQQQQQQPAAVSVDEDMAVDWQQQQQPPPRVRRERPVDLFASQLCIPEWILEVPRDLGSGWFVMARPEGTRCLVVASNNQTVSRQLNGDVLHRFESPLPNGAPKSPGPPNGYSLLDCIYDGRTRTYFIVDLLVWRSMELFDCSSEFRLFFLRSKHEEDLEPRGAAFCADAGAPDPWPFKMRPLLYYNCDAEGLRRAYTGYTPFVRDGLLLIHTQGHYEMGISPLTLLFKDAATSRYLTAHPLGCVLAVRPSEQGGGGGYELVTLEGLVVGRAAASEVEGAWGMGLGPSHGQQQQEQQQLVVVGRLARFRYDLAREQEQDGQQQGQGQEDGAPGVVPVVEGLRFEKPCSASRAVADPWSKILFNSRVRLQGQRGQPPAVSFDDLLRAAEDGMES